MANNLILNRLFTIATFKNLIEQTNCDVYSTIIKRYIDTSIEHTNAEVISEVYDYLRKKYRNEYYYKNTILNKLLLGVHSTNTTTALTQISISAAKADFVLINGKAVVYEIKTELDNLERLDNQIKNYYKAFDRVCVLTCDEYAQTLISRFSNTNVGVYVLTKNETIKRIKEPLEYNKLLNLDSMFRILNKPEYEELIYSYYGMLPTTSQVKYYGKCKEMFMNIPVQKAYQMFLKALKSRNIVVNQELFNSVPYELKSLAYFSQYGLNDYKKLNDFLSTEIGGN